MKKLISLSLFTVYCSLFTVMGCSKNPVTQLIEPANANASPSWSGTWVLYDDELRTGGGVMNIGWGPNFTADFNSRENPYDGVKCLKLYWDGNAVSISGGTTNLYTGFSLIVAKNIADNLNTQKNLSPGGFKIVSFWARKAFMSSNTVLRVESPVGNSNSLPPSNAIETALTDTWQHYTFDISGSLGALSLYVNIVLKTTDGKPGNGATVYLDDIELAKTALTQ